MHEGAHLQFVTQKAYTPLRLLNVKIVTRSPLPSPPMPRRITLPPVLYTLFGVLKQCQVYGGLCLGRVFLVFLFSCAPQRATSECAPPCAPLRLRVNPLVGVSLCAYICVSVYKRVCSEKFFVLPFFSRMRLRVQA